ncbi:unnamed protein product, partial [Allacma fusca]
GKARIMILACMISSKHWIRSDQY